MHKYKLFILSVSFLALLVSCNSENKTSEDSEKAYQDYKAFVIQVEQDTVVKEKDLGAPWTARSDSMRATYDRHRNGIIDHLDSYKPERREEINGFDDRVEVAFESRQKKYDDVSYRYKFRQEMLGLVVNEDDMSSINASNIAETYGHFVKTLQRDMENFTQVDWQLIEGWWNALENRRKAINGKLPPSDKESIANYTNTYKLLHDQAVINEVAPATALTQE